MDMYFRDLTEVVTVDGKRNRQWKEPRAPPLRPQQELPIVNTLLANDAQLVDGT